MVLQDPPSRQSVVSNFLSTILIKSSYTDPYVMLKQELKANNNWYFAVSQGQLFQFPFFDGVYRLLLPSGLESSRMVEASHISDS